MAIMFRAHCLCRYSVQPESIVSSPSSSRPASKVHFFAAGMAALKDLMQNDGSITRKLAAGLYRTCPDRRSAVHAAVDRDLERIQSRFTLCQRRGNITLQRTCGGRGAVCGDKQHPGLGQMAEEAHGVVPSMKKSAVHHELVNLCYTSRQHCLGRADERCFLDSPGV